MKQHTIIDGTRYDLNTSSEIRAARRLLTELNRSAPLYREMSDGTTSEDGVVRGYEPEIPIVGYWRQAESVPAPRLEDASSYRELEERRAGRGTLYVSDSDAREHGSVEAYLEAQARRELARMAADAALPWPTPAAWDPDERARVLAFLRDGADPARTIGYRGSSRCRICGCLNGSSELTDGAYRWPEGLAHYVEAHDVGLPAEFVAHAVSRAEK